MDNSFSNHWDDGKQKWLKKENSELGKFSFIYDFDNAISENLSSCDVKTDEVGVTMKIEKNGTLLRQFETARIMSWYIDGSSVKLFLSDSEPFNLFFISMAEAVRADYRIYLIINGADIVGCDDDTLYRCTPIKNLNLSFT